MVANPRDVSLRRWNLNRFFATWHVWPPPSSSSCYSRALSYSLFRASISIPSERKGKKKKKKVDDGEKRKTGRIKGTEKKWGRCRFFVHQPLLIPTWPHVFWCDFASCLPAASLPLSLSFRGIPIPFSGLLLALFCPFPPPSWFRCPEMEPVSPDDRHQSDSECSVEFWDAVSGENGNDNHSSGLFDLSLPPVCPFILLGHD